MQYIEFAPGKSARQIAVVRNQETATQTKRTIVGTEAKARAAKSQSWWSDETPLFKDLAEPFIHLLQRLWRRSLQITAFKRGRQGCLRLKGKGEQLHSGKTTIVGGSFRDAQSVG